MRIAIDYRPALFPGFGIGRYVRNLVPALLAADPSLELRLYGVFRRGFADLVRAHEFPEDPRAVWCGRAFPARLVPLLARLGAIDAKTFCGPFDLFHDTDYAEPPAPKQPRVATLYDTAWLKDHGFVSPEQSVRMERSVRALLRGTVRLITISEFAKRELIAAFDLDPDRITVTPLGVDPVFQEPADGAQLEAAKQRHGLRGPYIMYMGTLEPRKNVMRLVRAFARFSIDAPEYELALVGRAGWAGERVLQTIAEEGVQDRVRVLGRIPDAEAVQLLKGADVFAYPSLYEGFGLPALEGMAAGVPVLASQSPALAEVCGDGALLVDPRDELAMAAGLRRLALDRGEALEIAARGAERAGAFTWARTARETLAVYRAALQDRPA